MRQRRVWNPRTRMMALRFVIELRHPDRLDEHPRSAELVLLDGALAACERVAKEVRYPTV